MIYWKTEISNYDNLQKTLEGLTDDRWRVLNVLQQPGMTGTEYVVVAYRMPPRDNKRWRNNRSESVSDRSDDHPGGDEAEGNV